SYARLQTRSSFPRGAQSPRPRPLHRSRAEAQVLDETPCRSRNPHRQSLGRQGAGEPKQHRMTRTPAIPIAVAALLIGANSAGAENADPVREAKAIAAAGLRATRDGDRLTLHLRDGTPKTFVNAPSCGDDTLQSQSPCVGYELLSYKPAQGLFALRKYFYE